jgi:hypothetical protein
MEDMSDNVSYLHPSNPSIYFRKKFFDTGRTNLLSCFGDKGQNVHVSKDEKVGVHLRIKPTKDAAQMLVPPREQTLQAKDSHTLVLRSLKDRAVH